CTSKPAPTLSAIPSLMILLPRYGSIPPLFSFPQRTSSEQLAAISSSGRDMRILICHSRKSSVSVSSRAWNSAPRSSIFSIIRISICPTQRRTRPSSEKYFPRGHRGRSRSDSSFLFYGDFKSGLGALPSLECHPHTDPCRFRANVYPLEMRSLRHPRGLDA